MEAEVAGLLGALLGATASIATTFLSNRHAAALQAAADSDERQERAREFQRENLLACQDMMQVVGRLTAQVHHADAMAFKESGTPWNTHTLPHEIDQDLALNIRRFVVLIERVENDELRNELKALKAALVRVTFSTSSEAAESNLAVAMSANEKTMEHLGVILRKTY